MLVRSKLKLFLYPLGAALRRVNVQVRLRVIVCAQGIRTIVHAEKKLRRRHQTTIMVSNCCTRYNIGGKGEGGSDRGGDDDDDACYMA